MSFSNEIFENYRDNKTLRAEYHKFISEVFPSASFMDWEKKGFWTDNYNPFSIIKSDKIISNASVAFIDIIVNGVMQKAIQLGACGTLPDYRNLGYSHKILTHVINRYQNEVDLFFLFANESALNFYPKFGFKRIEESIFIAESSLPKPYYTARRLDIEKKSDYILLRGLISNRLPITKRFGAENYDFIIMWHIINLYAEHLFYLDEEDAIIIKQESNNSVHVLDVIFRKPFDLEKALSKTIFTDSIGSIRYYFAPDQLHFKFDKVLNDDTGLFILGELDFGEKPFRFPITAIT